jgi:hypothetical protein
MNSATSTPSLLTTTYVYYIIRYIYSSAAPPSRSKTPGYAGAYLRLVRLNLRLQSPYYSVVILQDSLIRHLEARYTANAKLENLGQLLLGPALVRCALRLDLHSWANKEDSRSLSDMLRTKGLYTMRTMAW